MKLDIEAVKARFLQVILGLVRIVATLWQFISGSAINISRTNGVIVTQLAISACDHLEPLLPVDDVLHGCPDVVIIKRRHVGQHRKRNLLVTFGDIDHDTWLTLEQVSSLRRYVVHRVKLTRAQGIFPS